jgi:hypothetical protein
MWLSISGMNRALKESERQVVDSSGKSRRGLGDNGDGRGRGRRKAASAGMVASGRVGIKYDVKRETKSSGSASDGKIDAEGLAMQGIGTK